MSNAAPTPYPRGTRVLFFGRPCRLSAVPLRALIDAGAHITGVAVPAPPRPAPLSAPIRRRLPRRTVLPLAGPAREPTLESLAAAAGAPVFEVADLRVPAALDSLAETAPEVIAVSCFPLRLPGPVRALARRAAVNVHPSLLPRHRGPDPLFWVYRAGDDRTGVTVHLIADELDAGDIVAQRAFPIERGLPGDRLEARCAEVGADLLVRVVAQAATGTLQPRPQDPAGATYEGWPAEGDLRIDPDWPCQHAWHFARGVLPLGYWPWVSAGDDTYSVKQVLRVREGVRLGAPLQHGEGLASIQLSDGVLDTQVEIRDIAH